MKVTAVEQIPGSQGTWKVESETNKGTFYYVQALQFRHKHSKTTTAMTCNCWEGFKKLLGTMAGTDPIPCKHCEAAMKFLEK